VREVKFKPTDFSPKSYPCKSSHTHRELCADTGLDDLFERRPNGLHVRVPGFQFVLQLLPLERTERTHAGRTNDHLLVHLVHLGVEQLRLDQIDDVLLDVLLVGEAEDAAQVTERDLLLLHGERQCGEDAHLVDVGGVVET